MMAATETASENYENYSRNDNNGPPSLSITIPKASDLKITSKRWEHVQLPIDILLLAVKDPEFLSCYYFMSDVFRSYTRNLGYVYFGNILGKDGDQKLKVALMTCLEGGGEPGGAAIVLTKAVEILQPKALLCVGSCSGLHRGKTKLGDVVVSAKLTTYAKRRVTSNGVEFYGLTTPVSRDMSRLIRQAGFGWEAPLENPEVGEVKVHCDGEFLSGPEQVESSWRRDELVQLYPNAIAVELDGDGVFAAAHDLKTEWVVIKGISCYADCSASLTEDWVPYACTMAASVMNNILSEPMVFEQWPHYQSAVDCHRANTQNGGSCQSVQPQSDSSQIPLNQARQNGSLSDGQFSTQQVHGRSLPLIRDGNAGDLFGSLLQTFLGNCDSGQLNYKGRIIHYSARRRIHSLQELEVYDATARDQQSQISAEAHHYYSSQEAIHHAVEKLKGKLRDQGILSE